MAAADGSPGGLATRRPAPQPFAGRPPLAPRVRVAVVDDHPAVRVGLCELLADQPDFVVVGAAGCAEDAVELAGREPVDVAVVDYQLGRATGLWLSRKLKRMADPPGVVMYSGYYGGMLAAACVVAEADALISKTAPAHDLFGAIRAAAAGHAQPPHINEAVADAIRGRLSAEEQTIFGMLIAGFRRPSIARHLALPEAELEVRLRAMLAELEDTRPVNACADGNGRRIETRPRPRRRSRG